MRFFRHFQYGFFVLFAAVFVFSGAAPGAEVSIPKMMTWTSYDVGSSGYMMVGHVSTTLFEKYGIKIRIIPAGTDIPRVYPVRLKDAEVAFHGLGSYFMQEGIEDYRTLEWGPQPVRALYFAQHPGLALGIRGDSDIKSFKDLKGKRIAAFPTGVLTLISEQHLNFAGLTWDDVVKVQCPGYTAAIRMVMEGKVDATHINPTASLAYEMAAMPYGIRYVELPPDYKEGWERIKKRNAAYGYFKATIGAGLSEDKPLHTISYAYPIALTYDFLSEEKAYIITKLLHETYPAYAKKHKSLAAYWSPEGNLRLFDDYPLPMHKGAIHYLKEIGKWTAEREAKNQQRLKHQAELKKLWDATVDEALAKKMKSRKFPAFWLKKRAEAGF
ncbi:MAG: TAXI family TRAP transporter solute-binding subunit [Deltaproteobacteria bacterium]|nr:TAXI family TRAP transporter solute-binding subunit [Deltaproteobacteria bacterium]MBW1963271.1 TAXI family TRAP transporter solute-binding subunit [Deltaproteobacteria bacterium]MBW1993427.1 TAXI family TRAP transporter solute-binding subunit [Deltaproteobacteria bacterium]MBW2150542.1 TAXI family TRAP transporter solute-binding subunit [Deltaproteobacteria bacterium]